MNPRVLTVLLSLWGPGLFAEDILSSVDKVMPDMRLVGGASHCSGTPQMKKEGDWTPVNNHYWDLTSAAEVCRQLDCGSAVSLGGAPPPAHLNNDISHGIYFLPGAYISTTEITCSESVRLVNGTNLCSGRLEVKSDQLWSSVCEEDFDQQDAEVVCRELGCGPPSALRSTLYLEDPVWTKEFRCIGNESVLLDCESSRPARKTCSSGKAVGLTCADPDDVRLVGGANSCNGTLELKHQGDWKAVDHLDVQMNPKTTDMICGWLGCGSTVSTERRRSGMKPVWHLDPSCVASQHTLRDCVEMKNKSTQYSLEMTCSKSVRLVNGTNRCSGRLEVKSDQLWSSVCEEDFDQQDAEVVCREFGCEVPSVFRGELYGGVAPVWTEEFWCKGHESHLLDCGRSGSVTKTCSADKAVGLTCSDPHEIRLVKQPTRCGGKLEMKNKGEWRPVADWDSEWDQRSAATVCRQLDCGSVISTTIKEKDSETSVWWIKNSCVHSASALWDCMMLTGAVPTYVIIEVICSDLLTQPNISLSHTGGGSQDEHGVFHVLIGSNFTITCSAEPQFEGSSFQLIFTGSHRAQNYTLPAVGHSAHFFFPAADRTHKGEYRCVHDVHAFFHIFTSESPSLHLAISGSLTDLIIRLVVLSLGVMLLITAVCITSETSRRQKVG